MKSRWYLWPIACLYGLVVYLRNCFFDWGWLKSRQFKAATISVGNITVGGTGKTPHTEYIIQLLQQQFNVAMVSRGYKRKSSGLQIASSASNSAILGDEPYQVFRKFPQTLVVVEANRCKAIDYIEKHYPSTDAVVLDDAFQHRYVEAGMSILLIDYNRLINKDKLLPVGNLREPISAKLRASVIVITKCPPQLPPIELRNLYKDIAPIPYQRLFYSYFDYGQPQTVFGNDPKKFMADMTVLMVTGIAQPTPLVQYLLSQVATVQTISYPDHYAFTKSDWKHIQQKFDRIDGPNKCIVVTEKDAAKLVSLDVVPTALKQHIWALPIKVAFLQDGEKEFNKLLVDYVSKNKRDSRVFSC